MSSTCSSSRPSLEQATDDFQTFVLRQEFPCLGARAAVNNASYSLGVYDDLASERSTAALAQDLSTFTRSDAFRANEYATFIAVFSPLEGSDELEFERLMWEQLGALNEVDAANFGWDASVRSDPSDPKFSFSFAGQALYVIGLHPNSSRIARRFRWPAMIFNPHRQFERLRAEGQWNRMRQTIRERDLRLQGSVNPMLSDFGEASEARQYSGRAVEENWRPPFVPAKTAVHERCPFAH